jgi:hypothetical protein
MAVCRIQRECIRSGHEFLIGHKRAHRVTYAIVCDTKPEDAGNNNRSKVREKVSQHNLRTQLLDLIFEAVNPSGRKGFKETHKKHDKVDVKVNGIQKVETCVGAVNERKAKANGTLHGSKFRLGPLAKVNGVSGGRKGSLQETKPRVNTQQEEVEEQEPDPVLSTRKCSHDHRPSTKDKTESSKVKISDCDSFEMSQVSQGGKDGESRDKGKHGVGSGNDKGVERRRFITFAVGTKSCHDTKL